MTDKERIECKYKFQDKEKFDGKTYCTCFCELCEDLPLCDDNCQIYEDFKQLTLKTQLIDEVEEVIKPYQEQIELDALSLPIAIESILERKEQECEELKEEQNEIKKFLGISHKPIMQRLEELHERSDKYKDRILELEQECEELKERLVRTEEDLRYQCVDCMNCQSDRYRKALEEIEEVCIEYAHEFADGATVHYYSSDEILDIINKTKGKE